jgi:hypothetical protein
MATESTLGYNQPPIQWVPGVLPLGGKQLTTHLRQVMRLRVSGIITHSPTCYGVVLKGAQNTLKDISHLGAIHLRD